MKKLIILLLLLVSTNVFAVDWFEVGEDEDGTSNYVDQQSIQRAGNKVKVWVLYDFKSGQLIGSSKISYLSLLAKVEYDCFEYTQRKLDAYLYSGNMGNGDIILSETNITKPTRPVLPKSASASQLEISCSTK